jgi:hypothetical protein
LFIAAIDTAEMLSKAGGLAAHGCKAGMMGQVAQAAEGLEADDARDVSVVVVVPLLVAVESLVPGTADLAPISRLAVDRASQLVPDGPRQETAQRQIPQWAGDEFDVEFEVCHGQHLNPREQVWVKKII